VSFHILLCDARVTMSSVQVTILQGVAATRLRSRASIIG
jgi:hypothetical protein